MVVKGGGGGGGARTSSCDNPIIPGGPQIHTCVARIVNQDVIEYYGISGAHQAKWEPGNEATRILHT